MTAKLATSGATEADLEARANAALLEAIPWIDTSNLKHQLSFSFQLGHRPVQIDGTKHSKRRGRLDILVESRGQRLAILELKRPENPLANEDIEQGLSYARVLHPQPPIVVVSNGTETKTYSTHDGALLGDGVSSEDAFADLMATAMKIAKSDMRDAIAVLMGPGSDVWTAAVRAASE